MRFGLLMAVYLLAAETLQMAALPALRDALPGLAGELLTLRLLALAGLLAGLLRGEVAGMLTAVAAAALFGISTDVNDLGPALVSFGISACLAGWLARTFRLQGFVSRAATLLGLLLAEALLWGGVRKLFWSQAALDVPWISLTATAVVGALIYGALAPRFKRDLTEEE